MKYYENPRDLVEHMQTLLGIQAEQMNAFIRSTHLMLTEVVVKWDENLGWSLVDEPELRARYAAHVFAREELISRIKRKLEGDGYLPSLLSAPAVNQYRRPLK